MFWEGVSGKCGTCVWQARGVQQWKVRGIMGSCAANSHVRKAAQAPNLMGVGGSGKAALARPVRAVAQRQTATNA